MPHILSCPNCAAVVVPRESGGVCPQCRTALPQVLLETAMAVDAEDMTRLVDDESRQSKDTRSGVTSSSGWLTTSDAIDHGRFEPGTLLGGRYRIVERLGRGGMGEVYRADDLKLGQPVALKFLPPAVDRDPAKLTQLHTEVRMARQVSHPNVCRVYDIDEIDGHTFLSMEYVDGEDLSTLLRRVGRFPEDRALEIARQICAGLAAAHERDVIHRDLKPANVMIDAAGKVRITDFGLAGSSGHAIRAGTPAYMAPEQLSGDEVTARSDIYALGLVLYEIFTGQRALEGRTLAELINKREQSGILPPSSIVKTIDPQIEQAIMRCLRPEIDARPASALAVAASLPGGDPLAAALAAGETPSPAMVAAAGSREALSTGATIAAVLWISASTIAIVLLYQSVILVNRLPLAKPPAALEDRAKEALTTLGYDQRAVDSAAGVGFSLDYARYIDATSTDPSRWSALRTVRPETFFQWHRTSPRLLVPFGQENQVSRTNPPLTTAGMTMVAVDANGRLSEFIAVPDPLQADGSPPATDWSKLFAAAGLPVDAFKSVEPRVRPPVYADERRAWEGPLPDRPEHTIRVEAAATGGRPVYFGLTGPWSRSSRLVSAAPSLFARVIGTFAGIVMPALMVLGAVLARLNIKAGRGDRAGAFRVATFVFAASLVSWLLGATHFADVTIEVNRVFTAIGRGLFQASVLWLAYLGLEPYVRRHSPDSLLGWSKAVAGHWRDPRVGVDVIVGISAGLAMTVLYAAHNVLPVLVGQLEPMPLVSVADVLNGLRYIFSGLTFQLANSVISGMLGVAGVIGFVLLLRRTWLAVLAAIVCFTPVVINGMFPGSTPRLDLAIGAGIITIFILTIIRAGLLSAVAALFTHFSLLRAPITTDFSSWHADVGLWHLGVLLTLAFGACYIARYGEKR
jgi:hypothetical protein